MDSACLVAIKRPRLNEPSLGNFAERVFVDTKDGVDTVYFALVATSIARSKMVFSRRPVETVPLELASVCPAMPQTPPFKRRWPESFDEKRFEVTRDGAINVFDVQEVVPLVQIPDLSGMDD